MTQSRPVEEADGREAAEALVFQEVQMRQFSDEECASGFAKRRALRKGSRTLRILVAWCARKRSRKMMKGSW